IISQSTTASLSFTAGPSDTVSTVLAELISQASTYAYLKVSSTTTNATIETVDIFDYISVDPNNVTLQKIKTRTEVRNLEVGNIPQEANTINQIATPILGWDSINNPFDAVAGRDEETDEELRIRFR